MPMLEYLFNLFNKFSSGPPKRIKLDVPPELVTILVVDDDTALREQLAMMVVGDSVKVKVAATTQEALAEMNEADILILDWRLGDDKHRGGQLVFQQWKQLKPSNPVAIISAYMTDELQHELLVSGAYNAVGKPAFDVIVRLVSRYAELIRNGSKISTLEANVYSLKVHVDALNYSAARQQKLMWGAIMVILLLGAAGDLSGLNSLLDTLKTLLQ